MLPTCTCATGGYRHHHAFGGTYPCEYPQSCAGCLRPEFIEPPEPPATAEDD